MNIHFLKLELIRAITEVQNETFLKRLLIFFQNRKQNDSETPENQLDTLRFEHNFPPIPEEIDLLQLKAEQKYSTEKLDSHLSKIDRGIWEGENVSELIKLL